MILALSGSLPTGLRVLVATRPVDLRRGTGGLAATVQSILQQDPFSGADFVFRLKLPQIPQDGDSARKRSAIPVLRDLRAKG
jgi:transposase